MQSSRELTNIISCGLPDISSDEVALWVKYLSQLKGCHLFSVASPEKDKAEWLLERRAGIGGSEVAAIMGENHWNSPRQIWMSKMGVFDEKPATQSEPAHWGNLLENIVAKEWGNRTKRAWVHIPIILQDDERPWLLANIDGFTLSDDSELVTGILEIKTTSAFNRDVWETGPLPFNYLCQTNWYCGITHLSAYTIVCLVGGQTLFAYDMLADSALFTREVTCADDFWMNYVKAGVEPPATYVDKELLKSNPADLDDLEDAPIAVLDDDDTERLVSSYIALREKMSALKNVKDAVYAQIKISLGSNVQAITKEHSIMLRKTCRRSCDFELLETLAPDIYAKVISESISVSMNIK